ncbi:DUF5063 domain-containing protein [Nocardia sp. AG03]|uniref:DUF5063 domain-containing protein n=1 Tax=Nocardia sp. AG03 TaxID=3025312 RepID=UPI00241830FF|nr:DUF5063 domain-containing protein [Nocardia sp. AG03]
MSSPPEVVSFASSAREFCATIEAIDDTPAGIELPRALVPLLATLIATASRLPRVEPTEATVPTTIDHDAWYACFTRCATALGPHDIYWTNRDLTDPATQLTAGSVADDLADIWRDLRTGLTALDTGSPWQDVVFDWRLSYLGHWGNHATDALRALHSTLHTDLLQP